MNGNRTYTKKEVADIFRVTKETVDNWRRNGVIKAIKVGERAVRFTREEVERLLNNRENGTDKSKPKTAS